MANFKNQQVLLIFDNHNRLQVSENEEGVLQPGFVSEKNATENFSNSISKEVNGLSGKIYFLTRETFPDKILSIYCVREKNLQKRNSRI